MSNLTLSAMRDAMQTVINATTALWYGTSDVVERGKVLHTTLLGWPETWIFHPDDLPTPLPEGWRHLREYAPTHADLLEQSRQWFKDHPPVVEYAPEPFRIYRRGWH